MPIEVDEELLILLRNVQACTVLSNAMTLHVRRCRNRFQHSMSGSGKKRWAQELKIACEMQPGLLKKAKDASSLLYEAIKRRDDSLGFQESILKDRP